MRAVVVVLAAAICGCTVGPNYKRPNVALPAQFRGVPAPSGDVSLGDRKWAEVFNDETLNQLISTAVKQNFDLRIAAERIQQARAQFGITRANQYPFVDLQGGFTASRSSSLGSFSFIPAGTHLAASYTQAGAALSWELDLFGRLRRLTESAQAQYLASEEAQRGVLVSLISQVTSAYFGLLEQQAELEVSRKTRDIAADGLRLTQLRRERGAASGLDVHQAEQLLYTATAQIEAVERGIAQSENALSLLLGEAPGDKPRPRALSAIRVPAEIPAGLPSTLLARRPDIRAAEQNLISANARIGAARALYFPQIGLTAFAGGQSRALTEIATAPARVYTLTPSLLLPVFRAGQIRNQVRLTEAQERELLISYQQAIYGALREVSDALIGYQKFREQRTQQEQLVSALDQSVQLSTLRYKGGLDSFLQVLDAQRNLFAGQLVLSQLQLQERLGVVQLYRALGGGWQ
jgi:multidrug efflux system outer membrane protein